jgi:hypothetical protein
MTINSYFYDSVDGDRPYSSSDFARAFDIAFENGVLIREANGGVLGFDIGGTNYTTVYEGKAIIEGHFVEVIGTETLTVPIGNYSGQIVIEMDADTDRVASLVVKTDQTPVQTSTFYELPLYNVTVTDGIITGITDIRYRGGAVPNNHDHVISEISGLQTHIDDHGHTISDISGLQTHIDKAITWSADPNGIKANMGKYEGTGKPVVLFLTSSQPGATSSEHRVWIQIDNF